MSVLQDSAPMAVWMCKLEPVSGFGSSRIHWYRYRRSVGCTLSDEKKSPSCAEACSHSPGALSSRPVISQRQLSMRPAKTARNPITLVDGFRLSKVVLDEKFHLA